jgi:hypothetical protein
MRFGVPDRLRSGDLLHERQACWLDYTTGTEMERVNGIAPSSQPWQGRILLLNHTREIGVPGRIDFPSLASQVPQVKMFAIAKPNLTSDLVLRTHLLCVLSYGDEMVRASGNAPDPGTDLVRCGV